MGLIYVNPEGPNGKPDPIAAARDIRETFARMAMNDEETVALIAGGHTFGKTHGAADPEQVCRPRTRGRAASRSRASAGKTRFGTGKGDDAITSGLEGAWTTNPMKWDNNYLDNLFGYEWELTKSPAGASPVEAQGRGRGGHRARRARSVEAARADDAHDGPRAAGWTRSTRRFRSTSIEHPEEFADAFAKAWYKLTHRDMGPRLALPWPAGSRGAAAVAGPGSRSGSCTDRRAGHSPL